MGMKRGFLRITFIGCAKSVERDKHGLLTGQSVGGGSNRRTALSRCTDHPVSLPQQFPAVKTIVYATLFLALLISPRLVAADSVEWTEDYAQALDKAKAEKKNLLLNFTGSDWCHFCKVLDKDVFASPAFAAWAQSHVVLVRVDFPRAVAQSDATKKQNLALRTKYLTSLAYPTVVMLAADEHELGRKVGYIPGSGPEAYVEFLKLVESGKAPKEPQPNPAAVVRKSPGGGGDGEHDEVDVLATVTFDSQLGAKAQQLCEQGRLPTANVFLDMLQNPKLAPVALLPVATATLRGRDVARRAAAAYVRVGWVYQCSQCNRWHTSLAGGYAIAPDTVVTARHVLNPPAKMKPNGGYPVVLRGEMEILPAIAVLAADTGMDAVVLRVLAKDLSGLPLSGVAEVGDTVFCFSDPAGNRGIFTSGIVNRLGVVAGGSKDKLADRRLTVGTDWAPGSSGAAILDSYGNAVGHVATIQAIYGKKPTSTAAGGTEATAPVAMSLHHAIPAGSVKELLAVSVPAVR